MICGSAASPGSIGLTCLLAGRAEILLVCTAGSRVEQVRVRNAQSHLFISNTVLSAISLDPQFAIDNVDMYKNTMDSLDVLPAN